MQLPALNLCECTDLVFCDSLNAFSMANQVFFFSFLGSVERRGRFFPQHVCCHAQTNTSKVFFFFLFFICIFRLFSWVCVCVRERQRERERVFVCLKCVQWCFGFTQKRVCGMMGVRAVHLEVILWDRWDVKIQELTRREENWFFYFSWFLGAVWAGSFK